MVKPNTENDHSTDVGIVDEIRLKEKWVSGCGERKEKETGEEMRAK